MSKYNTKTTIEKERGGDTPWCTRVYMNGTLRDYAYFSTEEEAQVASKTMKEVVLKNEYGRHYELERDALQPPSHRELFHQIYQGWW